MAASTDVFYASCTFWTGDWAWLAAMCRRGIAIKRREGRPKIIPRCPFCGSVGFEMDRAEWLRQMAEWETGASPKANGLPHPGYVEMLMWGEKRCFPTYAMLEAAWRRTR